MTEGIQPDDALPAMSDDEMYARVLASDATCDGSFYFGVVTTGVFCRPSCRVRKPLRENVRFFRDPLEARNAGLRPCRRCHPDDGLSDFEADREEVLALVAEMHSHPSRFPDVGAIVGRSGYGATRLFGMFRRVLGVTPATALYDARLEYAKRRLEHTEDSVLEVALSAGFRSLSAFHRRFKAQTGMTPQAYRSRHKEAA
jgi:AraC family transcriptional regulator of adaptative response / DNA-3-methyladenine glycosylase II